MSGPWLQGDLDNLCGFYAALNAMHSAGVDFSDENLSRTVSSMAHAAEAAGSSPFSLFSRAFRPTYDRRCGLRLEEIVAAINSAAEEVETGLSVRRLPDRASEKLAEFWQCARTHCAEPKATIILAFIDTKRELNHWIAVDGASEKTLHCRDSLSGSMATRSIRRSEACLEGHGQKRFQINPRQSLLLRVAK